MAEFVWIWSFPPQGTTPVELVEVAEKLRVREINLQNYIGRFLYQFWFKTSIDNLFCINENSPRTSSLLNFLLSICFEAWRMPSFDAFLRVFWDWDQDIHFSSLMVVKSFRPEATKMFDSLWCFRPRGPGKIFYWILHFSALYWNT